MICPVAQGGEAAWAGEFDIRAAPDVLALVNHFKSAHVLSPPAATPPARGHADLRDIKGQEAAKRALEIAAADGHNLLTLLTIDWDT